MMYKHWYHIVLTFTIFLITADPVFSQTLTTPSISKKISYGIQGGVLETNITNVSLNSFGDNNFQGKIKTGFTAGVFVEIPFTSYFHLQPEVNYSLKGYKASSDNGTFTRSYNFVDVPLLLKFYPLRHLHVSIGPQFSYRVSTLDNWSNPDATFIIKYQRHDNLLTKAYAGINAGVGVDLGKHILVNAGYSRDLNSSYKSNGYDTPGFKNQVFDLRLGYRFLKL